MASLNVNASFQVSGGPSISASTSLKIEAYDKVEVTIKPGQKNVVVRIQPGAQKEMRALVVKSSLYDDAGKLSYIVKGTGASEASKAVNLDGPQIFAGAGAISLFGVPAPVSLELSNDFPASDASKEAIVEIFVGRIAIAAP